MPGKSTTASMDSTTIDRTASLRAYPTVSAAARMIGVVPSTLTRRDDCRPVSRGARDHVLPPAEVMRLAAEYRKRSLNEVAAALIALAREEDEGEAARVEAEVDVFFGGRQQQAWSATAFLAQAKRHLPPDLYRDVEKAIHDPGTKPHPAITGHTPSKPATATTGQQARPRSAKRSAKPRLA